LALVRASAPSLNHLVRTVSNTRPAISAVAENARRLVMGAHDPSTCGKCNWRLDSLGKTPPARRFTPQDQLVEASLRLRRPKPQTVAANDDQIASDAGSGVAELLGAESVQVAW